MRTWILLRGLSRETGHWGNFLPLFQQAFPNDAVLPIDFPGNGSLHQFQSPTSVPAMVEQCRKQLSEARALPPYGVVALSMGAMVSVAWTHAYPTEISHQVLINTSLRPMNPFYQRLRPHNYPGLLRLLVSAADDRQWEQAIWRMTSRLSPPETIEGWVRLRRQHPVRALNALRQLWAASRFTAPLVAASAPTLLLASSQDALVSVACSRAIAHQWHWPLAEHLKAGHDLPLDDARWVIDQVLSWESLLISQQQAP
jgi:pimeloyl-ACP methyl ester carboxylesterase